MYLRELRPDIVKVDRALVSNLTRDDPRLALVAGVTAYAHALGSTVVCEGVETLDDLRRLREIGVDCAQGYALARPAPTAPAVAPEALASCSAARPRLRPWPSRAVSQPPSPSSRPSR